MQNLLTFLKFFAKPVASRILHGLLFRLVGQDLIPILPSGCSSVFTVMQLYKKFLSFTNKRLCKVAADGASRYGMVCLLHR
jgi:hypothetical protein